MRGIVAFGFVLFSASAGILFSVGIGSLLMNGIYNLVPWRLFVFGAVSAAIATVLWRYFLS